MDICFGLCLDEAFFPKTVDWYIDDEAPAFQIQGQRSGEGGTGWAGQYYNVGPLPILSPLSSSLGTVEPSLAPYQECPCTKKAHYSRRDGSMPGYPVFRGFEVSHRCGNGCRWWRRRLRTFR